MSKFLTFVLLKTMLLLGHPEKLPDVSKKDQSPSRAPASYIPDDDVIVKPIENKISLYDQYIKHDKSEQVLLARNQIKIWHDNELFAAQYGIDTSSAGSSYFVPGPEEKWEYFKDTYFRYLRRKGETPLKDSPREWYNQWRQSDEVDNIDRLEERFKATTKTTTQGKSLPGSLQTKEVSIWKKTRFIFQPRIDQGIVILGVRTPFVYARAWVAANGETEFNAQQTFEDIGLRLWFNYYAHSGEYLTSIDKHLYGDFTLRLTANRLGADQIRFNSQSQEQNRTPDQNETLMLLYTRTF